MSGKLRLAAGGAFVGTLVIVLTAYGVQGKKMPDWLFVLLIAAGLLILAVSAVTWLWTAVLVPAREYSRSHGLRWPVFDINAAHPHQWLLDIAHKDAESPEGCLIVMRQAVRNWDVDPNTLRPWIEVGVHLHNVGVYSLLVGPAKGRGSYQGQELPEAIETDDTTRVPPRQSFELRLKQYIPREMVQAIYDERRNHKKVSLGIGNITVAVQAECLNAPVKNWRIQVPDNFFRAED